MTADEILQALDEQFEIIHHDPPYLYQLSSHFFPADTRLTAFRSADRWAVVFEILRYAVVPQQVWLDIYLYRNGVGEQAVRYETTPLQLLDSDTDSPLDGSGSLDPRRFAILWNDQRYDFSPSDRDYADAGIVFDSARHDPEVHANAQIVRYLCERLNHPFFLPEEELRELLAQSGTDDEAVMLLQTRNWHHPDISQEELPSQVRGFQLLSHALVSGDTTEWDRQDPAAFNTDWRVYDREEQVQEEQTREWAARQDAAWEALSPETRQELQQGDITPSVWVISTGTAEITHDSDSGPDRDTQEPR
jgi:hypothetical protein